MVVASGAMVHDYGWAVAGDADDVMTLGTVDYVATEEIGSSGLGVVVSQTGAQRQRMAKSLKLRISRVIPTFHSCRSKDPSTLPEDPVPSFFRLSPVNPKLVDVDFPATPPPSKPHRSSFKRHVSSAFISVGCGFGTKSGTQCASDNDRSDSPEFKWQKEEKWHVVAKVYDETPRRKIYNSSASGESDSGEVLPPPPPPPTAEKKKRRSKKKRTVARFRNSTSSADSGMFSSEGVDEKDDEETETLVSSSRSFSTDSSSEFNPHLETIRETPISRRQKKNAKKGKRQKRNVPKSGVGCGTKVKIMCRSSVSSPESESPARLSMFKKLIPCTVEGKVRESFAVVKKSEDPYEDFKRSMMEMILEKQMYEKNDLEQLLQCFLSLNSRHHHAVIVEAFSEIWEAMFCRTSTHQRASKSL
ncbi:hypothetical protein F0562_006423 [Nyssa sinensis]|uniref:Transcription repressor n=1 Tax=Nyssa sinensis TaxID=561372 RepID=A0A5J5AMA0_9ASTE|nr:hypothetical protein F0562_006423 [Nyssa sinensis]